MKPTTAQKQRALAAVKKLVRSLGDGLFVWAARKHLAIRGAERSAARIRREAEMRIARLRRVAGA
jgi:hypothetical protein